MRFHHDSVRTEWPAGNRITGGKIISVEPRDVKSGAAPVLRLAAQAWWQSKTHPCDCSRRWQARLGTPKTITPMAQKPARMVWQLIKYHDPHDPAARSKAGKKPAGKTQTPPP